MQFLFAFLFYVAFQIIGKYLLFINYLLSITCVKSVSTMTFEEDMAISPTPYAG